MSAKLKKNASKTVDIKLSNNINYQKKKSKQKQKKTSHYLVQPTIQQILKNDYQENIHKVN